MCLRIRILEDFTGINPKFSAMTVFMTFQDYHCCLPLPRPPSLYLALLHFFSLTLCLSLSSLPLPPAPSLLFTVSPHVFSLSLSLSLSRSQPFSFLSYKTFSLWSRSNPRYRHGTNPNEAINFLPQRRRLSIIWAETEKVAADMKSRQRGFDPRDRLWGRAATRCSKIFRHGAIKLNCKSSAVNLSLLDCFAAGWRHRQLVDNNVKLFKYANLILKKT